ncbi:uncharacterized protein [Malus domestica]|uniref:uncharacterized protein n=1 Tax=Malus domestica TaxID=3750 RepID=UPI003976D4FD
MSHSFIPKELRANLIRVCTVQSPFCPEAAASCAKFAYIISQFSLPQVLAVGSCFDSPDDLVLLLKTWQSPREHPLGGWSDEYAMHLQEVRRSSEVPESDTVRASSTLSRE